MKERRFLYVQTDLVQEHITISKCYSHNADKRISVQNILLRMNYIKRLYQLLENWQS